MARVKYYAVYKAGSTQIDAVTSTCITKAVQKFISTLERKADATYTVDNRQHATIRYKDNHTVMSDYVVQEI